MTTAVAATCALADIAHLLETVEAPHDQLERALALLHRFVPYNRCVLYDARETASSDLIVSDPADDASADDRDALRERLAALYRLVADQPDPAVGLPVSPSGRDGDGQLAFPVIAVDQAIGILLVERPEEAYNEEHLQLLSVVAAQIGGYLTNVRLQFEEKRAIRAMQRAASLLEHIDDGFLEVDPSFVCVTANAAAAQLLRLPVEELVGSDLRQLTDLLSPGVVLESCQRALDEKSAVHLAPLHYAGSDRWLMVDLYPTELGLSLFLRDVTEQHENERFRDLLSGIVGHDLRTPLNAISLAATVLRHDSLGEQAARAADQIERSVKRMAEMTSGLLDLTRIRQGQTLPLRLEEIDLASLCAEVTSEVAAGAPGREVACDISGALSGSWDRARLTQALTNLVDNAVRHGTPGTPVRLSARADGEGQVRIEVHNEGSPIPAQDRPTVFQAFRQGNGPEARAGSLGLGLYITNHIIRAHGGTIDVTSSEEAGTTFTVRLPSGT